MAEALGVPLAKTVTVSLPLSSLVSLTGESLHLTDSHVVRRNLF